MSTNSSSHKHLPPIDQPSIMCIEERSSLSAIKINKDGRVTSRVKSDSQGDTHEFPFLKKLVNANNSIQKATKTQKQPKEPQMPTISDLPAVCSVRELAAYLGVGKNTAYDLVKSGQIQAVRVGRQYRIRKEAVLEYLEGKK